MLVLSQECCTPLVSAVQSASGWVFLQDHAALLSALAAVAGLIFAGWQARGQAKAADLQALFQSAKLHAEGEEKLLNAANEEAQGAALADYYNVMETSAAAVNHKLYRHVTREMETGRLVDACATVQVWLDKEQESNMRSSPGTFAELDRFRKKYRKRIDEQIARLKGKSA